PRIVPSQVSSAGPAPSAASGSVRTTIPPTVSIFSRTVAGRESTKRTTALPRAEGTATPRSVVSYRNVRSIVETRPRSSVAVTRQSHWPSASNVEYEVVYVPGGCATADSSTRATPSAPISCAVTVDGRTSLYESGSAVASGSPLTSGTGGGGAYTPKYSTSSASPIAPSPAGSLGRSSSVPSNAAVTALPG